MRSIIEADSAADARESAQKRQKKSQAKPMWMEKAQGIKLTPPRSTIFRSLLVFSEVLVHLFLERFF